MRWHTIFVHIVLITETKQLRKTQINKKEKEQKDAKRTPEEYIYGFFLFVSAVVFLSVDFIRSTVRPTVRWGERNVCLLQLAVHILSAIRYSAMREDTVFYFFFICWNSCLPMPKDREKTILCAGEDEFVCGFGYLQQTNNNLYGMTEQYNCADCCGCCCCGCMIAIGVFMLLLVMPVGLLRSHRIHFCWSVLVIYMKRERLIVCVCLQMCFSWNFCDSFLCVGIEFLWFLCVFRLEIKRMMSFSASLGFDRNFYSFRSSLGYRSLYHCVV